VTVSEAARILLEHLDGVPRARAELLASSGIPDKVWLPAIRSLLEAGSAIKTGSKRGTRYLAGSYELEPVKVRQTATIAASYCGLVEKVLNDIALMVPYGAVAEEPRADEAGSASSVVETVDEPNEEEDTDQAIGVLSMLRARGVSKLIDHRSRGGCLWVLESPGVEEAVKDVAKATGARFYYKDGGVRSTGWRSAWWTEAE